MTWSETFDQLVAHYAAMAMTPGCWAAAQHRVAEMEQEQGGHWIGLRAAVGQRIKAAGFKPHPSELANWWDVPSKLQLHRPRHGGWSPPASRHQPKD